MKLNTVHAYQLGLKIEMITVKIFLRRVPKSYVFYTSEFWSLVSYNGDPNEELKHFHENWITEQSAGDFFRASEKYLRASALDLRMCVLDQDRF